MPFKKGFTLAVELSNVFPLKELSKSAFEQMVEYARSLKRSGSDIVVEEDLAALLGRGRIDPELEREFKEAVKTHGTNYFLNDSQVNLDFGQGPTVNRALRNQRYLSTVVQLTMLAYFHNRQQLAASISELMTKRHEMGIQGASIGPGVEDVAATLAACSAQASAFNWSRYSRKVQDRLQSFVPNYQYSPAYHRLSLPTLLAVIDLLYIVQSLPSDRKVSISSKVGCVTLTIWAHFILQLNVKVSLPTGSSLVFGNEKEPQVIIFWTQGLDNAGDLTWPNSLGLNEEPNIRLHEKDMEVIFDYEAVTSSSTFRRTLVHVEDRHPVAGYGLTYLKRLLNVKSLIPDSDPIYENSVHLAVTLALHCAGNLKRRPAFDSTSVTGLRTHNFAESWRILEASKLLFEGVDIEVPRVNNIAEFIHKNGISQIPFSFSFKAFLEKVTLRENIKSNEGVFMQMIQFLADVVLIFAHVQELKDCASMPILMSVCCLGSITEAVLRNSSRPSTMGILQSQDIFHALVNLLSTTTLDRRDDTFSVSANIRVRGLVALCSEFGWSVFFDTFGERDPADTRPEIIHVQRGTPTKKNSGERKFRIRDGLSLPTDWYPDIPLLERGERYEPRAIASAPTRFEDWVSQNLEFEQTIYYSIKPSDEWVRKLDVSPFEEALGYRAIQDSLWETELTSSCEHSSELATNDLQSQHNMCPLGLDVAVLPGWGLDIEWRGHPIPEKVIICLTYKQPRIRCAAVVKAVKGRYSTGHVSASRSVMLRTKECCPGCALLQLADRIGKWVLIL